MNGTGKPSLTATRKPARWIRRWAIHHSFDGGGLLRNRPASQFNFKIASHCLGVFAQGSYGRRMFVTAATASKRAIAGVFVPCVRLFQLVLSLLPFLPLAIHQITLMWLH